MPKKHRAVALIVGVSILLIVAAYLNPGRSTSPFAAPEIERIERAGGGSIQYIDRRRPLVLFIVDRDRDGEVDGIGSRDPGQPAGSTPLMAFAIAETKDAADRYNVRNFQEKALHGPYWLARSSAEAWEIQRIYKEVRAEYLKRHPGLKLPENADPATKIRSKELERFQGLLVEFRAQDARVHQARTEKASEVAQYRTYLAFGELEEAYRGLNEWERRAIFRTVADLPRGIKLDGGSEVTEILGIPITGGDLRGDFEAFLRLSYMEIDYMSAWSIFPGEAEKISKQYADELRSKGLKGKS